MSNMCNLHSNQHNNNTTTNIYAWCNTQKHEFIQYVGVVWKGFVRKIVTFFLIEFMLLQMWRSSLCKYIPKLCRLIGFWENMISSRYLSLCLQSLPCPWKRSWRVMRTGFMDSTGNPQLAKVLQCGSYIQNEIKYFRVLISLPVSPCRRRAATASQSALSLHGQNHDHLGSWGGVWCVGGAGQCPGEYTCSTGAHSNRTYTHPHFPLLSAA